MNIFSGGGVFMNEPIGYSWRGVPADARMLQIAAVAHYF
jgi:hypothetical protein